MPWALKKRRRMSTFAKFDLKIAASAATHSVQFRLRTTSNNNMADTEISKGMW
jgi:hypothetical protein